MLRSQITKLTKLKHSSRFKGIVFVAAFAVIGSVLLFTTQAATPSTSIEPEQGTKTVGITTENDLQASNGQYVQFGSATTASEAKLGVYTGPANVNGQDSFASWLGAPVPYVTDYVDHRNSWVIDFSPDWLTDAWGAWVNAVPGRRLALAVPLLEESARGQFDQCTSGDFDQHFQTLGQNLVSKNLGNSIIRLGYEMNNPSIGPWDATSNPAGFKSCFRRVVGVMRAVPGSNFSIDWCTNAGVPGGSSLTSFDDYYPGDDVVDIIGMDQYDIKWMDTTSTPEQRWDYLLTRTMGLNDHKAFAAARGKPMSFPEWGLYARGDQQGGGGDNPYFIDKMADWFASNNVAYQAYFNVNYGGGVMSDFPNGEARYKARFGL